MGNEEEHHSDIIGETIQGKMMRSRVVRRGSNRSLGQTTQVKDTIRWSQRGNVTQDGGSDNEKEDRK